jgi:hypothetical protein
MAYAYEFVPSKFNESLEKIRLKFPLIREAIYINKSDSTQDLVGRLSDLDDEGLEKFAAELRSDELDLPLIAFRSNMDEGVSDKLDSILKIRFRKKLFLLNWLILQNNYKNPKLISSMKNLCDIMKKKYPDDYSETIFPKIPDWHNNMIDSVSKLMHEEKTGIEKFFAKYQFLQKSKFAYDFYTQYFLTASKDEIINNWQPFIRTMNSYVVEQSAAVINIYLELFEVNKFSKEVTDYIFEKYGCLFEESEFWNLVSNESRNKFIKWMNLKIMEDHFGKEGKKYHFWSVYIDDLVRVARFEHLNLIFIYFESCVVVDLGGHELSAYLYYKETFDLEYDHFINTPDSEGRAWRIFPEHVINARESVIENKRSDIYKFNYEFVGKLYLKEILKTEALKKKKIN